MMGEAQFGNKDRHGKADAADQGDTDDVFEVEPILPNDPLLQFDNVIVTPHSAYYTEESLYALQYGAADEVARVLNGEEPISAVNRKVVDAILNK